MAYRFNPNKAAPMRRRKPLKGFAIAGVGVAALAILAAPAIADVKAGVDAWTAGNYDRAVAEWQLPAQNGDADALFNLAQAYRLGRGVDADVARARQLYAEAASKGHVKAADNYGLLLFQQGEQARAMPLIRDAASRGDPRAQYVLGLAHFNADYAEKDWVRAYALMTLSNGANLPQAGAALQQMDNYIPMAQRQEAQTLARELETQAVQRRTAQLAAIDLDASQAGTQAAPQAAAQSAPQSALQAAPTRVAALSPAPAPASAPVPVSTPVSRPAAAPVPVPPPSPARTAVNMSANSTGPWRIQLGAFGVAGNADRLWDSLAANPALAGTNKALVPSGRVMRLQAVGYPSRAAALAACDALKRGGQPCLVAGNS